MDEFDFLQGDEPYKFSWTEKRREGVSITIFNQSLVGNVVEFVSKFGGWMKKNIKQHLFATH